MRVFTRRRLPALAGLLLSAAALGTMSVSSAQATTPDATWAGSDSTFNWGAGANWLGGSAPAPDATLGTLTFPYLGPSCDYSASPTVACYSGGTTFAGLDDDLGTITANKLVLDASQEYVLLPAPTGTNTLTLNGDGTTANVGLQATSDEAQIAVPYIGIPIQLGAPQTWDIDGGGVGFAELAVDSVTGSTDALTLNLSNNGNMSVTGLATGALTILGSGQVFATQDAGSNDAVLPTAGTTLGEGAQNVSGPALNVKSPGATSGPIDASAAVDYDNQVTVGSGSPPEASLTVTGSVNCGGSPAAVCLGSGTAFGFDIDGNDTTPGVDSSEMTVDGNVNLNGARLGMTQGYVTYEPSGTNDCVTLTPGNTYTLLTTSGGTISGSLYYAAGNDFVGPVAEGTTSPTPTTFGLNCHGSASTPAPATEAYINYGATTITETIAAAPTSTQAPTISGTAQVGQTLSVSGNGGWSAYPAPTYAYQWEACSGSTCTPISGATGSSFVVTAAQEGDMIELQVTATNSLGHASASSSASAAVPTPTAPSPTPTPTPTPMPTPSPAATLPSAAQVRTALNGIGRPAGSKALAALIRSHSYKASFKAPSAGSLRVTWTTVVTTGTGKHRRHKRVTVATASGTATAAGRISITIHLTAAGRTLLERKPRSLHITATESFQPAGGGWITLTKHFTL